MFRNLTYKLLKWKENKKRKPLLINGARQVGKTWLMKEFGKQYYKKVAYFRFDNNRIARDIFEEDFNTKRILERLSILANTEIIPNDTLIIFDEIQESPKTLTALKYFCEDMPQYHIMAAGSLLGVKMSGTKENSGTGFPVGKVNYLNLYPMTFEEFAVACGEEKLINLVEHDDWQTIKIFKNKFISLLKDYFVIGGMPEAVLSFIDGRNYKKAFAVQRQILRDYVNDFSKHAPANDIPAINIIWNSIPAMLAKENKKFVFKEVSPNLRTKSFKTPLWWLTETGLIYSVNRVEKPAKPLSAYSQNSFKLFLLDVGLLSAMSKLDVKTILDGNRIFTEFKGALTEQFVHQQLQAHIDDRQYYWTGKNSELDFLIDTENGIFPIEVKAETNLQAKSLKFFCEKFSMPYALRFSMGDYNRGNYPFGTEIIDYPLYAIKSFCNFINK